MESNYSFALMLLLKYPAPIFPNGPKTFVEDATFLRNNLTSAGGAAIIEKYSYRSPPIFSSSSPPGTPSGQATSPRQKLQRTKSPLPSPARFLQQQGVGDLFQGAARGLLDRGERLGINQAVRDAVGEAKKNVSSRTQSLPHGHDRFCRFADPASGSISNIAYRCKGFKHLEATPLWDGHHQKTLDGRSMKGKGCRHQVQWSLA